MSITANEEKVELQEGAASRYDFSFLPKVVAEYNSEKMTSDKLLTLLKPHLARQTSILLSQDELKALVFDFFDSYYQRKVYLELAVNEGYLPNEGLAGLRLDHLKKTLGEDVLRAQFNFTGLRFSQAARYFAEESAMNNFFKKSILPQIKLNEADALTYYFDNENKFKIEESVKISQIFIGFIDDKSKLASGVQAQKAIQLLNGGKPFTEVARLFNFDGALSNSGQIDRYFSRKELRPELHKAFQMKMGQVSEILESVQGFHIIQLREKRAAGQLDFDGIKENLLKQMIQQAAQDLLNRRIVSRLKSGHFKLYVQ